MRARDRRALAIGMIIVGTAALVHFGLRPYLESIGQLRLDIERESSLLDREAALSSAESEASLPEQLAASLDAHAERMFRVSGLRTSDPSVDPLAYTRLLGSAHGFDIRSTDLELAEGPSPGIVRVRVLVLGDTDVSGIEAFLRDVAAGPKDVRVVELSLTRDDTPRSDGVEPLTVRAVLEGLAAEDDADADSPEAST